MLRRLAPAAALGSLTVFLLGCAPSSPAGAQRGTTDGPGGPIRSLVVARVDTTWPHPRRPRLTIVFDRPVVRPARAWRPIVRTIPERVERHEWRGDSTLVVEFAHELLPGDRVRVVVTGSLRARDGTTLGAPLSIPVRVPGMRVFDAIAEGTGIIAPSGRLSVSTFADADTAALVREIALVLDADCPAAGARGRRVPLRFVAARPLEPRDLWRFGLHTREAMQATRGDESATLVGLELEATEPLPGGCIVRLDASAAHAVAAPPTHFRVPPPPTPRLSCGDGSDCPEGPIVVAFGVPVRGAEVARHVHVAGLSAVAVGDTAGARDTWALDAVLRPRTAYFVTVDSGLRDVHGRPVGRMVVDTVRTTGYPPQLEYQAGSVVLLSGARDELAVRHVNVDSVLVVVRALPDSLAARALRGEWMYRGTLVKAMRGAPATRVALGGPRDEPRVTRIPIPGGPGLRAVQLLLPEHADSAQRLSAPFALVQRSRLAVQAKIASDEALAWVLDASTGRPVAGVLVTRYDDAGRALASARTDDRGIARVGGGQAALGERGYGAPGWVTAEHEGDRILVAPAAWGGPLQQAVGAYGLGADPYAASLVTERGIYRPGEPVYAHLVLREGRLGALRAPRDGGAVRIVVRDRDAVVAETTVVLSAFGTAALRLPSSAAASVGTFWLQAERRDARGRWITAAHAMYAVAEYRAPEFLLEVTARDTQAIGGETTMVAATGRYLYGAPFAGAPLAWSTGVRHLEPSELRIPGTDGWTVGASLSWFDPEMREDSALTSSTDGVAALDDSGRATIALPLPRSSIGAPLRLTIEASGEDLNRQRIARREDVIVHPSTLYAAARDTGSWFWRGGAPRRIDVVAVTLAGRRVAGRRVAGVLERRRWKADDRELGSSADWTIDTVARCTVVTATEPVPCTITPPGAGAYTLRLATADGDGRVAVTTLSRWASGAGAIDWWGATPHRLHLVADRDEYVPGDTAEVLVSAPEPLEGWLAIEREGVLDERRLRLAAGTTTLRIPIESRFAPNVHVTVLAVRPWDSVPATEGAPPARAGAVALRVRPVAQSLRVTVEPLAREHRPGDSAKVRVLVRDAGGRPDRAEVTLWAVDEGVLALTDEELPEIVGAIYRPRGLGVLPTSTLLDLAADPPPLRSFGRHGRRIRLRGATSLSAVVADESVPGLGGFARAARPVAQAFAEENFVSDAFGSGGGDDDEVRRRFLSTAFFLSGATTDASGEAVLAARLPDNLTTFRIVAIAVSAADRYGAASAPLLVTKPLVLRAALPRFVRPGDAFLAGGVVARRDGGAGWASVRATAGGALRLEGESTRGAATLGARGAEVRFAWRAGEGDSAVATLHASSGGEHDAVEIGLPVRERVRARRQVVSGILEGSAAHELILPEGVDLARSLVRLDVGTSPLALVAGFARDLRVYPWDCTEQVASAALPLVALLRAQQTSGARFVGDGTRDEIARAVRVIAGRQGEDGAIGLWSAGDWSTPRLTAHAGRLLLDAREAGIAVDERTLRRLGDYLELATGADRPLRFVRESWWGVAADSLAERLAAAELLRRLGRDTAPVERALLAVADSLDWEERALLARMRAERGDRRGARRLLAPLLAAVAERDGAIQIPDSVGRRDYFRSRVRPVALLLEALLETEPRHRLVGPLTELVVRRGASGRADAWNTHDYASAVRALMRLEGELGTPDAAVQAQLGQATLSLLARRGPPRDTALALADIVAAVDGAVHIPIRLKSRPGARVFYHLTVTEQPRRQPASAQSNGIAIERWYERAADGRRVEGAVEGDLVRVRVRVHLEEPGEFVVVDDPLPAGLEAVDAALRTSERLTLADGEADADEESAYWSRWYGWSHSEVHDDRVVFFARYVGEGAHELTYLARATTSGRFELPATHAEAMYEPETSGDGTGGAFEVRTRD